tara:strand:- start:2486 stop:2707 length:222 start_codon:yes stop_codon:yes gene_type:complete
MRKANWKKVGNIVKNAIMLAEDLFPDKGSGSTKKAFVINLINDRVDIPILNEGQEEAIISILIDVICTLVLKT